MLKVFHPDVYAFIDQGSTFSILTWYLAMRFDFSPYVLLDCFYVSTLTYDYIVARRVHRNCPISLYHWVTNVDFVDLDMLHFNVILGMDLLHSVRICWL